MSETKNVLARVLLSGDSHLSSKNYGAHQNYPAESLHYYTLIGDIAEQRGATHIIGPGDLSFGRFHTLDYRTKVEEQLARQYNMVQGRRWEVKGNHDQATYGMTEYEYYLSRGMFRGSEYIKIGNVNINMIDYGKYDETEVHFGGEDEINVIVTHGYFTFENSQMPNYGEPFILDKYEKWYGVDYIICGHIHQEHMLQGAIRNSNGGVHECVVHYLPCLSRPSYHEGANPEIGTLVLLTVYDNGEMLYETIDVPLLPLEQSFNLALKEKQKKHQEAVHVDVSDVVAQLTTHKRTVGDPEAIIMSKADIPEKYRLKAVSLLRNATR